MSPPKPLLLPLLLLALLLACGAAAGGGRGAAAENAAASTPTSAAASSSSSSSTNDWCLPGLECPRFDLLEVAGSYQVRRYDGPAAWAVTVVRHAPSLQAAQLVGLARLARYWKGDNDRGRPLPPTAPLVTALFPTKSKGHDDDTWSVQGVFVVAAPLPASEAHFPPKPLRPRWCPWGDPDARRGAEGCRVRVFRSGVEGGCRNDGDGGGDAEMSWLAEAVEALVMGGEAEGGDVPAPPSPSQGGDGEDEDEGEDEGEDDPPCFLDGPNGDCSEEEEEDGPDAPSSSSSGDDPSSSTDDDPNRHRKRRRRHHRAKGTVLYASEPFDGFPTERDALSHARALRLALHADHRGYCRRVFFLASYSPPWQLLLRRNEVWVPSCAHRGRNEDEPVASS
jgi:hypothetical protein